MKQDIIQTSIELVDEKGFSGTSIQEIVDRIGVTKGTFYYYFNSKQELLKDIHLNYIEDLVRQQECILNDQSKNCTEKLYDIVYMLISNIRGKRQSARIFFREIRHLNERHINDIKRKRNEFRQNCELLIKEGMSKGEFDSSLRADMLTLGILGTTNWSYYWYNPDGAVSERELTDTYIALILNGISKTKGAESLPFFNPDDSRAEPLPASQLIREELK